MSWSPTSRSPYYTLAPAPGTASAGVGQGAVTHHYDFDQSSSIQMQLQPQPRTQTVSPSSGSDNQSDDRPVQPYAPSSVSTAPDNSSSKERVTVPSACVACRSKHLKCDGGNPCNRCSSNSFECVYVRSRRGFKGPRKNGLNKTSTIPGSAPPAACPMVYTNAVRETSNISSGLVTPPETKLPTPSSNNSSHPDINRELDIFSSDTLPANLDPRERCIEAFYYHFYPAHPFIIPRSEFMIVRKKKNLSHLEAAMRYVGSFYVKQAPTTALGEEAETAVYEVECPDDIFRVQAMLVLAIGLDGYTFQEKALQLLMDAQDLAIKLGMNNRDFSFQNGDESNILEESLRRTWWELYIVDGMIAGVHQKSSFRLYEVEASVGLPCEEKDYSSGKISPPHYMQNYDDDSFSGQECTYSSFTYRIAAIRNLGRILSLRKFSASDEAAVDRVDAHLVNWKLHLPDSKKTFFSTDGRLDEVLFQAHMITSASTILLHRELSQLDSSVAKTITSCAPHKPIVAGESYNVHASKTIQAAQDISKLISLPVSLAKHTHFFTCVVTLASIVHLSCWSVLLHDEDLKQQLRLNTGALKTLWQIWPSAGNAFGQVKGVAQEIHAAKKHTVEIGYWVNYTNDEVMQSMIQDQTTMEELQFL